MAFQKKEWKSVDTLSHVELNRIEDGILQNSQIEIPEIPDMTDVVKFAEFSAGVDPAKRKQLYQKILILFLLKIQKVRDTIF